MEEVDLRFADKIGAEYGLFALAAPHYGECQRLVAETAARIRNPQPKILEIGCGTGLTTLELCRVMPRARITAVDNEQVMLNQAQKVLPSSVTLVYADALTFLRQLPDRKLDVVVTAFCLHNTPPDYRREVYREIGRVLRDSGMIVVADKIAQDNILEHWRSMRDYIEAFAVFRDTDYPELQREWTEHYLLDDRIRLTEAEQRELFEVAGFLKIRFHKRWLTDAVFSARKLA